MTTAIARRRPGITARLRRQKAARLKRDERANKETVRERDGTCRFPLCPCTRFNLFLEVSHKNHKGMGGDPTGERSAPELMVYICNWRHKEDRFSIDKRGLRWEPLTDAGAAGPIAWWIDLGRFPYATFTPGTWVELAREVRPRVLAPLSPQQIELIEYLTSALKERFR